MHATQSLVPYRRRILYAQPLSGPMEQSEGLGSISGAFSQGLSFIRKYQTPVAIGAGVALGFTLWKFLLRRRR